MSIATGVLRSLGVVLCASSSWAQQATERALPPRPPVATAELTGSVICADTRKPARGATVFIASANPEADPSGSNSANYSVITGTDGTFTFHNLLPGDYAVLASLPGYLMSNLHPETAMQGTGPQDVPIQDRVSIKEGVDQRHDFVLRRGASVAGRVLFSDGSPAINVQAFVVEGTSLQRRSPGGSTTNTDDDGRFRIYGLRPGRFQVGAALRFGYGYMDDTPTRTAIYNPSTFHRGEAKVYDLHEGEALAGVEIVIPLEALRTVRGKVVAGDGQALNMGEVRLTDPNDETFLLGSEIDDDDGTFLFRAIPPGTYKLAATKLFVGERVPDPSKPANTEAPLIPRHAFANTSLTLVVKDDDLTDLVLTTSEIPMGGPPKIPATGQ